MKKIKPKLLKLTLIFNKILIDIEMKTYIMELLLKIVYKI